MLLVPENLNRGSKLFSEHHFANNSFGLATVKAPFSFVTWAIVYDKYISQCAVFERTQIDLSHARMETHSLRYLRLGKYVTNFENEYLERVARYRSNDAHTKQDK